MEDIGWGDRNAGGGTIKRPRAPAARGRSRLRPGHEGLPLTTICVRHGRKIPRGVGGAMRRWIRAATVVVALSGPASIATVGVSAASATTSTVSCNKLYGYASGAYKFSLRKCAPKSTEKALTGYGTTLTKVGGPTTYTWTWNGGGTTVVSLTVVNTGTCPAGYTPYTDTGAVTGGTSKFTQVGDSIQMSVCRRNAPVYMGGLRLAAGSAALL
jgi:hypothetical protein